MRYTIRSIDLYVYSYYSFLHVRVEHSIEKLENIFRWRLKQDRKGEIV